MTWNNLLEMFAVEYSKLRNAPGANAGYPQQFLKSPAQAQKDEFSIRQELDEAARTFARTGLWPDLEDEEQFFLRLRLRFAYEYALISSLSMPAPQALFKKPGSAYESPALIVLFLVDIWQLFGVDNWLSPIYFFSQLEAAHKTKAGSAVSVCE